MTTNESLLLTTMEECVESAVRLLEASQRVSKQMRFGGEEVQPGQPLTNSERVLHELIDVLAMWADLEALGLIPPPTDDLLDRKLAEKKEKVAKFLKFSAGRGLVSDMPAKPVPHPEAA